MSFDPHADDDGLRRLLHRPLFDRLEQWLDAVTTRSVLSALILVSVLPPEVFAPPREQWYLFFAVFSAELAVRLLLLARRSLRFELRASELALLLLDFLALISFLPFLSAHLQVLRLVRLLLLIGYWRGMLRELWILVTRRERRYQIVLVLILGAVMAFGSAVLLLELGASHDFDDSGTVDEADGSFQALLWWSFRQIQDPGNLVSQVADERLMALSLLLTFSGLLLFSFFIGIGTTLVGELVERSRSQPLGLHQHTVILGLTPYTEILLHELAEAYRKNSRSYRGALMADAPMPEELSSPLLRQFRFRHGDPAHTADLERVNIEKAKRVIILGNDSRDPDAAVISAILATRQRNARVPLYPDLEHERNFHAARAAGDAGTHLVGSGSMLGFYLAQNVAYPGVHHLYNHLLQTSEGCEIYTYIFSAAERRELCERRDVLDLGALQVAAQEEHRTTLIGFLLADDPETPLEDEDLELLLNPLRLLRRGPRYDALDADGRLDCRRLRGVIGIAPGFSDLSALGASLLGRRGRRGRRRGAAPAGPAAPRDELSGLRLDPPRRRPRRVLILGAGPRVPRVVMELVSFYRELEITVLAGDQEPYILVSHDIQSMLTEAFERPPKLTELADEGRVTLELVVGESAAGEISARITVMVADWTHGHLLEEAGAVTLEEADVILFLPSRDIAEDRDGRIALDCLHLANLERTGKVTWRRGVHVLALLRDPSKGDLLEQRLVEMSGGHARRREARSEGTQGCRYTVIARERARHRFLMQSVFVRGLNAIYLSLLSSKGQYLSRLRPSFMAGEPKSEEVELAHLAGHLMDHHGLLLVAYEIRDAEGAVDVVVDPHELRAGRRVAWSEVAALYVLGSGPDIAAVASPATHS